LETALLIHHDIDKEESTLAISARNQLKGKITEVILGDVMAHITVRVGQSLVESVITRKSADEMKLKKGDTVNVVVKATEVMIARPE
jgi:molybdopterin-binding protein